MTDSNPLRRRRRAREDSEELVRLALGAEPVFTTHAELLEWVKCVARRWLDTGGSAHGCSLARAAACTVVGETGCAFACDSRALELYLKSLPTGRLEALMRLRTRRSRRASPEGAS